MAQQRNTAPGARENRSTHRDFRAGESGWRGGGEEGRIKLLEWRRGRGGFGVWDWSWYHNFVIKCNHLVILKNKRMLIFVSPPPEKTKPTPAVSSSMTPTPTTVSVSSPTSPTNQVTTPTSPVKKVRFGNLLCYLVLFGHKMRVARISLKRYFRTFTASAQAWYYFHVL